MLVRLLYLMLAIASLSPRASLAAVVNADWRIPGDGLAILDTTNNLEWLDLTQTVNMTTDAVAAQFGVDGMFEGWRYATRIETAAMLTSAGATNLGAWHIENIPAVELLFDIWGELGVSSSRGTRSSYFAVEPPSTFYRAGAISIGNENWQPGLGWAGESGVVSIFHDRADAISGSALVREAVVPEPTTLTLAALVLIGVGCWRRKHVKA